MAVTGRLRKRAGGARAPGGAARGRRRHSGGAQTVKAPKGAEAPRCGMAACSPPPEAASQEPRAPLPENPRGGGLTHTGADTFQPVPRPQRGRQPCQEGQSHVWPRAVRGASGCGGPRLGLRGRQGAAHLTPTSSPSAPNAPPAAVCAHALPAAPTDARAGLRPVPRGPRQPPPREAGGPRGRRDGSRPALTPLHLAGSTRRGDSPHACIEGRTETGTRAARARVRTASPLRSEFPSPTASRARTHVADGGPSTRHSSTASPSPTTIGSPRGQARPPAACGRRERAGRGLLSSPPGPGCPAGGRFREETGPRVRPTTPERALRWPARSLPPPGRRGLLLPAPHPLLVAGPRRSPVSAEPLVRPVHSAEPHRPLRPTLPMCPIRHVQRKPARCNVA